jgi:protein arginine kinase activator
LFVGLFVGLFADAFPGRIGAAMLICTACQKAPATTKIMDVASGNKVNAEQHLCSRCAEALGLVAPKVQLKMSPEMLEDLLGTIKEKSSGRGHRDACPGCGMTPIEFKQKGRFGCPRCYEAFRADIVPLLQRVHEAQSHRGRLPAGMAASAPADVQPRSPRAAAAGDPLARLRRQLEDAISKENFEEAARLRDELRRAEKGDGGEAS